MSFGLAASGREIVFKVVPRNTEAPVNGILSVSQVGDSSVRQELALQSGITAIDLPPGSEWVVSLDAKGWWAAQQTVTAAGVASQIIVPAWRFGTVSGRFVAAKGTAAPRVARLIVETPPDLRAPPEIARNTAFECPVDGEGAWSCGLPATTLDLAVVGSGFIPVYRWDLKVEPGRDTLLGTIRLSRGASLVAWLDGESTRLLQGRAKARLLRGTGNDPSVTAARLAAPVAEATFGGRGGVQLTDIPPGVYLLEVTAPGFAPSRIHPIEIRDQREAVLRQPILLQRPLTLRLVIDPPAAPGGTSWNVKLNRSADFGGSFDPTPINIRPLPNSPGAFEVHDQSAGRFLLEVSDERRELRVSRWLEIRSAAEAEQRISIPLARVRGKVTFGGEPVAARLYFGGRSGAERVTLYADEEGEFEGWLSRMGSWPVDVDMTSEEASTHVDVEVSDSEHEIAIEIPDTILTGTVIDAGGERARQASVTLIALISGSSAVIENRTKPDGTFRFRGVPTGQATLSAQDLRTGERSPFVSVPVVEGASSQVELRIESQRMLKAVVTSRSAPVPGAAVSAYPLVGGTSSQVRATTDLAGKFELQLPASTRRAIVAVRAAGRVLQSFEVAVGDEPAVLELASAGGTVRLLLAPETVRPGGLASAVGLYRDGLVIPGIDLMQWAVERQGGKDDDGSVTLRDLAPGMYRACIRSQSRCVQHVLTPGSTVDLDLR